MRGPMSSVQEWLNVNAIGYHELEQKEREAISDFCLLWSLFEEWILEKNGCIPIIKAKVARAAIVDGGLDFSAFGAPLAFFKDRYCNDEGFNARFQALRFRGKDSGQREVEVVLSGKAESEVDMLLALLIIVYRLRNNLLHGEKWSYALKQQFGNFTNANIVLMHSIEWFRSRGFFRPE